MTAQADWRLQRWICLHGFGRRCRRNPRLIRRLAQRGHQPPSGALQDPIQMGSWHSLSMKLTNQDACTFFFKYGCDSEGLLPYEVFAMRFLSGQSCLLALAPELAGPYPQGERLLSFA
jgi:hypothetical protein